MFGFAPLGALPLGGFPGFIPGAATFSKAWRRLLAQTKPDKKLNVPPPRELVRVYDPEDEKILERLLLDSFFPAQHDIPPRRHYREDEKTIEDMLLDSY